MFDGGIRNSAQLLLVSLLGDDGAEFLLEALDVRARPIDERRDIQLCKRGVRRRHGERCDNTGSWHEFVVERRLYLRGDHDAEAEASALVEPRTVLTT